MTPAELVTEIARQYDNDEGDLQRAALARLSWRKSRSGKACARCGEFKQTADFGPDNRKVDGLQSICKGCDASRRKDARRNV